MKLQNFTYRGKWVPVHAAADIESALRPNGRFGPLVQRALSQIEPWERGEHPIFTVRFAGTAIFPMAVHVLPSSKRTWGIHVGHKASKVGLSPFVDQEVSNADRGYLTVELAGKPDRPVLIRAYGGHYTPPLPWMTSASRARGGHAACLEYWRLHAYHYARPPVGEQIRIIKAGAVTTVPPHWFRPR